MQKTILILASMLSLLQAAANAQSRESPLVELWFQAASEAAYTIETVSGLTSGDSWVAVTNIAAGPARMVTLTVPARDRQSYFRVVTLSPATEPVSMNIKTIVPDEANSVVVPFGFEDRFGIRMGGFFWSPVDYQTLYHRTNFILLQDNEIEIVAIAFRLDVPNTSRIDVTIPKVEIWLSTFTNAQISRFRAVNRGEDVTLVYSNRMARFTAAQTENPRFFPIIIPLQRSFVYDRERGDLLLEYRTEEPYSGRIGFADGAETPDGAVHQIGDDPFTPIFPQGSVIQLLYRKGSGAKVGLEY